ncbi:MAG: LysM peptidoglycan-binding domain-containing protein, partial [Chloroflexota bacterium]
SCQCFMKYLLFATYAYMRANDFAGTFKWMLNNVDGNNNPYEENFGVFSQGDEPKAIRNLIQRFSEDLPPVEEATSLTMVREVETGFSYRFNLPQQITVGGYIYQDETIGWRAEGIAHCFIKRDSQELIIDAHGAGQLSLDPWDLIPSWDKSRETDLYRVYSDITRTRQKTFNAGESVTVDVRPGAQYAITMGAEAPTEESPPELPQIEPNPGEHVVILGDFENDFQSAQQYIERFAPDFTFAAAQAAGRWAYVTVVATPEAVPDTILDDIRSLGAVLVERVIGDTPAETKATLDDLVRQGQRFLSAVTPPPQEEPPIDTPPPADPVEEIYVVQPGDTLGKIATTVYGDFRLWPLIFEANRDKLSNPSLIRVGMELRIPEKDN